MLLVDAKCEILPEQQQEFIRETTAIVPVVRKEAGCTRYELVADNSHSGTFHFIEEWESERHLSEHLARPHMKDYLAKTAACHAAPTRLTIYEVSNVQSVTLGE